MLPGFRFLFAAIVLSISMLMFGVGAAALLRAAHQEFSSIPSWRAPSAVEAVLVSNEVPPALAMLRVDTEEPEQSAPDPQAGNDLQAAVAPEGHSLPGPEPEGPVAEAEKVAALEDVVSPAEDARPSNLPDVPLAEPAQQAGRSLQIETPSPAAEQVAAAADQTSVPAAGGAETEVATRGGPPESIGSPPTIERRSPPKKRTVATIRKSVPKKQLAARRNVAARPAVARPRLQQPAPFSAPFGDWDNRWPGQPGKT